MYSVYSQSREQLSFNPWKLDSPAAVWEWDYANHHSKVVNVGKTSDQKIRKYSRKYFCENTVKFMPGGRNSYAVHIW